MENPLLDDLLAAHPPVLTPVSARVAALVCDECGLAGGCTDDYWEVVAPTPTTLCQVCALGRSVAWETGRVRLALVPELRQAQLNSVVTLLTVNLMRSRAGASIPAGIDAVLQAHLLDALQQRAHATAAALPCAATPTRLRKTLQGLPPDARAGVAAELTALRYLPEPSDPELARFFNRRRAMVA